MQFDINDFFYNIIAGLFFVLYWLSQIYTSDQPSLTSLKRLLERIELNHVDSTLLSVLIVLFLLGVGLVLHGIWRSLKYFIRKLREKIHKHSERGVEEFYRKDNLLWLAGKRDLPEFFSSRAALWGSLIVATSASIIMELIVDRGTWGTLYLILALLLFISLYFVDDGKKEKTVNDMTDIINDENQLSLIKKLK